MIYNDQFQAIVNLEFDIEATVFEDGELEIYLWRPSVLSKRFAGYDLKKNFQVWLKDGERKFRPNHLRVMIDLDLRLRSRPDLKPKLAKVFDDIFYGNDPAQAISELKNEHFEHYLNSLEITAYLSQLFIIEQAYGYRSESKYNPRTLFYQGWIRQVIDSGKEIDNLIMSIANRQPPAAKYTAQDDKNNKNYQENPSPLWWLS